MLAVPLALSSAIRGLAPVFARPGWQPVQGLLTGAVLAPGKRTVPALRQSMGRRAAPDDQSYQRVLKRAGGAPLTARRLRRRLLVAGCVPRGGGLVGLDDTIERRRGDHMAAHGISREPVRSAPAPCVKVSGRRWRGGMLRPPSGRGQPGRGLALADGAVSL